MARSRGIFGQAARFCSFCCFFATLFIYSPCVMTLQAFDTAQVVGWFAEPYLACTVVSAAVVSAATASGRWQKLVGALESPTGTRVLAALYALANILFCLVVFFTPPWSTQVAVACAVVAGASVTPLCCAWSRVFGDADLITSLVLVACATAVTAVVGTVLSFVPRGAAWAVVVALLLAGVAWPAARCAQEPPTEPIEKPRGDGRPAVNGRAFVSVMGMPLIGMAIASFTMGVSPAFLFDGTVDAQRLGALVGSAALLGLVPLRGRRPLYTFVYTVYLPVFAAVVMVLAAVPATLVPSDAAVGLAYAFFSMVSCVAVASSNAIANAREFPRSFVIALLVGVFCLAGTAGLSFGGSPNELASDNGSLLLLLMALFGSWILLGGCARAWRLTVNPSTEGPLATGATSGADAPANNAAQEVDPFESRIAQLAKRYGLSPRETQIAGYVGRGHSSVFVAKTLLISESTVYTHTHNIYRKLGIASREEFIQLVTGSSEAATA